MAEIDYTSAWRNAKVELAANDPRIISVMRWILEVEGSDDESDEHYKAKAISACNYFDLDPARDLEDIMERCENLEWKRLHG